MAAGAVAGIDSLDGSEVAGGNRSAAALSIFLTAEQRRIHSGVAHFLPSIAVDGVAEGLKLGGLIGANACPEQIVRAPRVRHHMLLADAQLDQAQVALKAHPGSARLFQA